MTPELEKKIEEAASKHCLYERGSCDEDDRLCNLSNHMFVIGAKSDAAKDYWQKGMYTEEEVSDLIIAALLDHGFDDGKFWFNQNKKND